MSRDNNVHQFDILRDELVLQRDQLQKIETRMSTVEKDIAVLNSKPSVSHDCRQIDNIKNNTQKADTLSDKLSTLITEFASFTSDVQRRFKSMANRGSIAILMLSVLIVPTLTAAWCTIDKAHEQQTAVLLNTKSLSQHDTAIKESSKKIEELQDINRDPNRRLDRAVDRIISEIHAERSVIDRNKIEKRLSDREQNRLIELLEKAGY